MTITDTSSFNSKFLRTLHERGFIHQSTDSDALDALLEQAEQSNTPVTGYIGFDCTAPSLHVGSLMQIMLLHWFQHHGHRPIVLMGGGTTKIGDPSFKDESRAMLNDEQIATNMAGIREVFSKYLTFAPTRHSRENGNLEDNNGIPASAGMTDNAALMVNNDDWLAQLHYLPFLRDIGKHFSINRMLSMESVKLRIEREGDGLSFLEFNYMILQAYDFLELNKRHECRIQFGGSDQWGNIINGIDLTRRVKREESATKAEEALAAGDMEAYEKYVHQAVPATINGNTKYEDGTVFGLTTPLLTTASGAKMGKTASGAVWLNADMLSPYDYWQYWRNTEDADVGRFLKLFTTLEMDEIAELEKLEGAAINEAKQRLATEVTAMCHGRDAANEAAETAHRTFVEGAAGAGLPTIEIPSADLTAGINIADMFVRAGLAESKGEVRRLIKGGGARLNDEKIDDDTLTVNTTHLDGEQKIKLSAGKKKHALVKAA